MFKNHNAPLIQNGSSGYSEDFFEGLMENRLSKIFSIILASSLTFLVFSSACGIIWFEKFGSDLRRLFINKMLSSVCWSVVAMLILVQVPEIVFHFFLPFPEIFCRFYIVCKNATVNFDQKIISICRRHLQKSGICRNQAFAEIRHLQKSGISGNA